MKRKMVQLLLALALCSGLTVSARQEPKRPLILGIAHIAFQVSDLSKAREHYGELLGYDEAFQIRNQDNSLALTYFKVNERQYLGCNQK